MSKIRQNDGFTLIELMIVVAIIGILASLAISVYQTYTIRAQIASAINMADGAKSPVVDAYIQDGAPPTDRAAAGMSAIATDSRGLYVSQIEVNDGRVDVMMGNRAHADVFGDVVSFTPYLNPSGGVVWRCGIASQPGGGSVIMPGTVYIPTTVLTRYLPAICRN